MLHPSSLRNIPVSDILLSCHWKPNHYSDDTLAHAGIPELHCCSGYFPFTSRGNTLGFNETHHLSFPCRWWIPLLRKNILSIVFRHTRGKDIWERKCSPELLVKFVQYCFHSLFMQRVRHIKQLPLDLESLTKGLSSLVLPSQQVHFSQHM